MGFAWFGGFVADYIGGLVAVGGDLCVLLAFSDLVVWKRFVIDRRTYKPRIKSSSRPTSYSRRVALIVVVEIPTGIELAAGLDEVDETMGRDPRKNLDDGAESGEVHQRSVHDCGDLRLRVVWD